MGFSTRNSEGNQSATKWGALLIGLSFIFASIGGAVNGDIRWATAINQFVVEAGSIALLFGIRDWKIWDKNRR